jgi:hypothetical protein
MVQNPNLSNSDKNDDGDCCKGWKEYYYATKEECDWIKCSFCEKWLFENCTILSKTWIDFGSRSLSKNLEKRKKSTKKEPHSDREHIWFDYNFVYFRFIILYCIIWGASFTMLMPKTPLYIPK